VKTTFTLEINVIRNTVKVSPKKKILIHCSKIQQYYIAGEMPKKVDHFLSGNIVYK
jgi:hypothetical protein